jgi:DUF4097 and DUF4098 domain-containing protein YvlB
MRARYALPLLLVLLAAPLALAQRGEVVYDQTFAFQPGDVLEISTSSPSVVVTTDRRDGAQVRVLGEGANVRSDFENLRFTAERRGNRVVVRTDMRRQARMGRVPSYTIEVAIPDRADLQVSTSSGSIRVADLQGDATVSASSGSVRLGEVAGDRVTVRTSSGSIRAGRLSGKDRLELTASSGSVSADAASGAHVALTAASGSLSLGSADAGRFEAQTASGSVRIEALRGEGRIRTGSGSVRAGSLTDALEVQTGSGGVRLELAQAAPLRVRTGSGSVEISAPRALRASVELGGGGVQIDNAFGFQGSMERRSARGTLHGGGERIAVATGSGRIRLVAR